MHAVARDGNSGCRVTKAAFSGTASVGVLHFVTFRYMQVRCADITGTGSMAATTFEEVFEAALRAHRAGALAEAITGYRRAAGMRPGSGAVQNNLALACKEAGDGAGALEAGRAAVGLAPHRAEFRINLGNVYRDMGRLDEAIAAYRDAL